MECPDWRGHSVTKSLYVGCIMGPYVVFIIESPLFPSPKVHVRETLPDINPYPTAFPYGNGMVLHFYQQQESSTTKTVHKVINKGLKAYV